MRQSSNATFVVRRIRRNAVRQHRSDEQLLGLFEMLKRLFWTGSVTLATGEIILALSTDGKRIAPALLCLEAVALELEDAAVLGDGAHYVVRHSAGVVRSLLGEARLDLQGDPHVRADQPG